MATQTNNLMVYNSGQVQKVGSSDMIDFDGDLDLGGNLIVRGTKIINNTTNVLIDDNHIYMNNGYTTAVGETGGLVVNYLPTSTATTVNGAYVAGIDGASDPTVTTAGSNTFTAGDFIQISGVINPGLYEVAGQTGTTLTVRSTANGITNQKEDFTQNQFVANASDSAAITKINLSVLRAGTDGTWEYGTGAATGASGITFTNINTGGSVAADDVSVGDAAASFATSTGNVTVDSQAATTIIDGHTGVTVDATNSGNVELNAAAGQINIGNDSVNQNINVGTAGTRTIQIGHSAATATNLDAAAITIEATAGQAQLKTTTSGEVDITSAANVDINATTSCTIDATTTMSVKGATGASFGDDTGTWEFDGAGAVTETGMTSLAVTPSGVITLTAGAASSWTTSAGALTLTGAAASTWSTASGALTLTSAAAASWSTSAGILTLDGQGGLALAGNAGEVDITTSGAFDVNVGSVDLDSTAAINIDGTTLSLDGTDSTNLTMTANSGSNKILTIASTNAGGGEGQASITATDLMTVGSGTATVAFDAGAVSTSGVTTMDLDSSAAIAINSSGGTIAIGNDNVAQNMAFGAGGARTISVGSSNATASNIDAIAVTINATGGQAQLKTTTSGEVDITSAAGVDINATTTLDVDAAGAVTIDSSGAAISIGADAVDQAINIGTDGARTITIGNSGAGNTTAVAINALGAAGSDINVTSASGSINLNAGENAADALTLQQNSTTFLKLHFQAGLVASKSLSFNALGANNSYTAAVGIDFTNNTGGTLATGTLVSLSTTVGEIIASDADSGAAGDAIRTPVGVCLNSISDAGTGAVGWGAIVPVKFGSAPAGTSNGKRVYLDTTAGQGTLTPPASGSVVKIGILMGANGSDSTVRCLWQPEFIIDN